MEQCSRAYLPGFLAPPPVEPADFKAISLASMSMVCLRACALNHLCRIQMYGWAFQSTDMFFHKSSDKKFLFTSSHCTPYDKGPRRTVARAVPCRRTRTRSLCGACRHRRSRG